jgi:hypothetical protein
MKERLTSRKFLLAVLSLACLFVLCWFRRIDGALFVTGLTVTVGAYLTANVAQKATSVAGKAT